VAAAQAGIVITFDQPSQTAQWGDLLVFKGVISYTPPDVGEIFLNNDEFTGLPVDFTTISQFFANVPVSLLSGGTSGDIELFDVQVVVPAFGHYTGTYKLFGGANSDAQDPLAQADFSIQVVPEPSSFLLFVGAVVPVALRRARKTS
jgi:hypothetical protein